MNVNQIGARGKPVAQDGVAKAVELASERDRQATAMHDHASANALCS
jgi:hypothetical protein